VTQDQAMTLALRYLAFQPRPVVQMQTYLSGKNVDHETIEFVVSRLKADQYLDDSQYARMFVENRARHNPKSLFALGYELAQKGIASSDINAALDGYDDEALARKCIAKKFHSWQHFDDAKFTKKILSTLQYRGFNYGICHSVKDHFTAIKAQVHKEDK